MKNEQLKKFCSNPAVYVLESEELYKKGDIVEYATRHGKDIELIIFKLVKKIGNKNYYSYIRSDGKNRQTILQNRLEKRLEWAGINETKATEKWEQASEGREFLSLGEPIKIGHHSEHRHRALIERNNDRMRKSIELSEKATYHENKAENIQVQLEIELPIDNPDCLDAVKNQLEKAKEHHTFLKNNPEKRRHSYSLVYAKKKVNDLEKRLKTAEILWLEN